MNRIQMASKVKNLMQELLDVTVTEHMEGKFYKDADMIWNEIVGLLDEMVKEKE
jgi:hypothetical protein